MGASNSKSKSKRTARSDARPTNRAATVAQSSTSPSPTMGYALATAVTVPPSPVDAIANDALQCCVCLEPALPFVSLSPCGHFLCGQCATLLDTCPLCKQSIVGKLHMPQVTQSIEGALRRVGETVPPYKPFVTVATLPARSTARLPPSTPQQQVLPRNQPAVRMAPAVSSPKPPLTGLQIAAVAFVWLVVAVGALFACMYVLPTVVHVLSHVFSVPLAALRLYRKVLDLGVVAIGYLGTGAVLGVFVCSNYKKHPVLVTVGGCLTVLAGLIP